MISGVVWSTTVVPGDYRRICPRRETGIRPKWQVPFVARLLLGKSAKPRGRNMKMPLIVAISLMCAAPLYAQDQQPNTAKLKADAQRVVSIIQSDKAKTQVYCEISDLGEQIGEADQRMDDNKAEALSRQVTELEKRLGPEYFALANDLNSVDPNSPEGRDIESILAPLDDSCD